MTRLIIFDCDGVLVDSELLSTRVLSAALAEFGVTIGLDEFRREFLGRSFPTVAKTIRRDFGLDLPADFEAEYRARLLETFETELRTTPGLAPMLDRLAVQAAVATSSSPPRVRRSLELTGLWDRFAPHIFTASEVSRGKPAPDLFLHVVERIGVRPEDCLVIEDSAPGLEAARAAGIPALHYAGGAHLSGVAASALAPLGAINHWSELPDLCPMLFQPEVVQ